MIELVIDQRRKDLGGFEVGRVLPLRQTPHGRAVRVLRPYGAGGRPGRLPAHRRCPPNIPRARPMSPDPLAAS